MKSIELTKGYSTIIDDDDFELVTRYKWHARIKVFKNGELYVRAYARIWDKQEKRYNQWVLSRYIMRPSKDFIVDHENGDALDNRRSNLKITTQSQNIFNKKPSFRNRTSKFRGVSFDKGRNKWKSYVTKSGKQIQFGRFDTELEAARVYNENVGRFFKNTDKWLNKIY